jgi:hypothetical protein
MRGRAVEGRGPGGGRGLTFSPLPAHLFHWLSRPCCRLRIKLLRLHMTDFSNVALSTATAFTDMRYPGSFFSRICTGNPLLAVDTTRVASSLLSVFLDSMPTALAQSPPTSPDAHVLSADPNCIICQRCCKRNYVF